jgi:hypothetical protein
MLKHIYLTIGDEAKLFIQRLAGSAGIQQHAWRTLPVKPGKQMLHQGEPHALPLGVWMNCHHPHMRERRIIRCADYPGRYSILQRQEPAIGLYLAIYVQISEPAI